MRGMRMEVLLLLGASGLPLLGFHPDYFPLQVSNQWIYRRLQAGAEERLVVRVTRLERVEQAVYAVVEGWPGEQPVWLRQAEDGKLLQYDPETQREKLWLDFAAPESQRWFTEIHPCKRLAHIASRRARFSGAIGTFDSALEIVYEPACADAGLIRDLFLPYVGLVHRTETSIAGPVTYELVYARLGSVTFVRSPEIDVALAVESFRYYVTPGGPAPILRARLTIRNHYREPFELEFPSSQRFDAEIRDASGKALRRWSDGRAFLPVVQRERIEHGESNYLIELPLTDSAGQPLPAGDYELRAWLTSMGTPLGAFVRFQIANPPSAVSLNKP